MIEIITGLPGSGKTLLSTQRMLNARRAGRKVLANFHSRRNVWDFGLWDDFREAENAYCVIDEAHMWLNSRAFKTNSIEDLAVFQQSRKQGLDLTCVVQHEGRLDIAIKEVASYLYRCKSILGKWTLVKKYAMDDLTKPLSRFVFRHNDDLYSHYWTTEVIGGRDGSKYQFGAASTGGVSKLDNGRITPTHYMIWTEFGTETCRFDEFNARWDQIAKMYNRVRGKFFTWRPFAFIDGGIYWTDEERETEAYTVIDAMLDSRILRGVESVERRFGMLSHL